MRRYFFSESRVNLVRERMTLFLSRIECRVEERIIRMCLEKRESFTFRSIV